MNKKEGGVTENRLTHWDDIASYTMAEAARYVRIPSQTLRAWVAGQSYGEQSVRSPFHPLLQAAEYNPTRLSFNNLIEAYTLRALRTKHAISIGAAREAMDVAQAHFKIDRLFLRTKELRTMAGELFLKTYSELIHLNRSGQLAMEKILRDFLGRIELDESSNLPRRFFPLLSDTNKIIAIDPHIAFGRPFIAGKGITTIAIIDRLNANEDEDEIAKDYDLSPEQMEQAIIYEQAA